MMDGIWIGGDYIPCDKVTTYFCSFGKDAYYYGNNNTSLHQPIPKREKTLENFKPMKHAAHVILAFWSYEE